MIAEDPECNLYLVSKGIRPLLIEVFPRQRFKKNVWGENYIQGGVGTFSKPEQSGVRGALHPLRSRLTRKKGVLQRGKPLPPYLHFRDRNRKA